MDLTQTNFRTEQTLMSCGLSPESINDIKSTRVVTHNGQQHVIHNSQGYMFEKQDVNPTRENVMSTVNDGLISQLREQNQVQAQQFSRFKQHADNRIMQLESQMSKVLEQLKYATETIQTLKSNKEAASNRAKLLNASKSREPVTEVVDRNGVAPADVSIEKMFYFGNT